MRCSCCGFVDQADQQFTRKKVDKELRSYRRKGPELTTRLLRDSLAHAGVAGATVLDIGAGIGALTFELLTLGASRAIVVEAAPAYLAVATEEAKRVDKRGVIEFRHADFLTIAQELPAAAIVALDRVICCIRTTSRFSSRRCATPTACSRCRILAIAGSSVSPYVLKTG
jgi:2-polyprenyl-3-methyl-5-hydroxy-6-metoxy-1,4-benzoquinol methylase